MQEELKRSAMEFHAAINQDPRFLSLKKAEEVMEENPEVQALSRKKETAEEAYALALTLHDKKSPEAIKAQQELYAIKRKLDEHPLVSQYQTAFVTVRDLEMQFDDILFGPFRVRSLSTEAH